MDHCKKVHVCVGVCMCILYVCMCVHVCMCIHVCMYACIHGNGWVYACKYASVDGWTLYKDGRYRLLWGPIRSIGVVKYIPSHEIPRVYSRDYAHAQRPCALCINRKTQKHHTQIIHLDGTDRRLIV